MELQLLLVCVCSLRSRLILLHIPPGMHIYNAICSTFSKSEERFISTNSPLRPGREHECRDINECELFPEICRHGECHNQQGDFRCVCHPGYTLDQSKGNCTDIDECEDSQSCLYGECSNEAGTFTCSCPPGFQLLEGGHGCVDRRQVALVPIVIVVVTLNMVVVTLERVVVSLIMVVVTIIMVVVIIITVMVTLIMWW